MGKEVLLSIIIPAYNAEKYICRCLESVNKLEIDNYEVIVVNDGSSDRTIDVVEEYAANNSAIRAFSQINKGQNMARICGIKNASGKYLAFLDADDWVDDHFFEYFIEKMEKNNNIDACFGKIYRTTEDGREYPYHPGEMGERIIRGAQIFEEMVLGNVFKWEICSKVYRKSIIDSVSLPIDNVFICEDLDWNRVFRRRINCAFYSSKYKYWYYVNPQSVTQNRDINVMTQHIVYKKILDEEKDISSRCKDFFWKEYTKMQPRLLLEVLSAEQNINDEEIKEYQNNFRIGLSHIKEPELFDTNMRKAICGTLTECKNYFYDLCKKLRMDIDEFNESGKKLYVYGTGFISEYLNRWRDKYPFKFIAYVVSDGQMNLREYKGKEVLFLSEIDDDREEVEFFLALTRPVQDLVSKGLIEKGYHNIYFMDTSPFSNG